MAAFATPSVGARPLLQLGVVTRRDGETGLRREPGEQRLRESRALDGVGPGRDLVEQDERAVGGRLEDLQQVAHVGGEGREAHLDRLLVADVHEHLVEDR